MKEQTLYICEFCNTQYKDKLDAELCEKNHKKFSKIAESKYVARKADASGAPQRIQIEFTDGTNAWYQKC